MDIVAYQPEHLQTLVLQQAQAWMSPMLTDPKYAESLRRAGPAFTALDGNRVIACAGVVRMWENRDSAWALLDQDCGRQFIGIYRGMQRFLDLHDTRRVEASVDSRFEAGHRLMGMLGFKREGIMRAYLPDGRDCDLYARIKD